MNAQMQLTDEQRGLAASYALGALDAEEMAAFERDLERSAALRAEVAAFQEVAADLASATPLVRPPTGVKDKLMRSLARPSVAAQAAPADLMARVIVRAQEGAWTKTPFPGVEVKRLFSDPVTGMITTLLKAAAGAIYPAHVHGGVEQVFVIDGDMVFDDHELDTGDYEVATGETQHSAIRTPNGCLALIIHSPNDKIIR